MGNSYRVYSCYWWQHSSFSDRQGQYILEDMCHWFGDSRAKLPVSENGWTNNELDMEWLRHFNKHTRSIETYKLLVLDNHSSHATVEFIDYAYEHKIVLLYLPSHSTHRLQPLDVSIFSPLATYYSELVDEYSRYNGIGLSKREWMI